MCLALFWKDEGCGLLGKRQTDSWTMPERTNSDLKAKRLKNAHALRLFDVL